MAKQRNICPIQLGLLAIAAVLLADRLQVASQPITFTQTITPIDLAGDSGGSTDFSLGGLAAITPPAAASTVSSDDVVNAGDDGKDDEGFVRPSISGIRNGGGIKRFKTRPAPAAGPGKHSGATASKLYSTVGLRAIDQRLANGGNQYELEPPDQALCVGNGFILESVNTVLRVRDAKSGLNLTGTVALNPFCGYRAQVVRGGPGVPTVFGPSMTDPTCLYDGDTQRFYLVVLTLSTNLAGNLLGPNVLDIAVSKTSDPRGAWFRYRLPVQNDGTQGTPDHGNGPAIGDYPQIGHDGYGFYITTNEFPFKGGFAGANLYAMSKAALATGSLKTVYGYFLPDIPAFTVMPTKFPAAPIPKTGTAHFVSTLTPFEDDGMSDVLILYTLTGTQTLAASTPSLSLDVTYLATGTPIVAPSKLLSQKPGPTPYADFFNVNRALVPGLIDPSDTRMLGLRYAAGKLWGVCGTDTFTGGIYKMGVFVFQIMPEAKKVKRVGVLVYPTGLNHLTCPTIAVNHGGKGAIGFTLVGDDFWPTAAYATLTNNGLGPVEIANPGLAPQDGFSAYSPRPRWGDYGAGAVDEQGNIYLANEFIAAPGCTLDEFENTNFACPDESRQKNTNWATAITKLVVK